MFMPSEKVVSFIKKKQEVEKRIAFQNDSSDPSNFRNQSHLIHSIRHALDNHQMQREIERQKRELQSLEARFRSVIDKNADGIIIVDSQGIIRFANPATESLFNCKTEQLLGQEFFGRFVIEKQACEIDISIMPRNGTSGTADMRVVQTFVDMIPIEGEKGIAEMRVVETEWEGKMAFLISLRDISQRLRAEVALRQERDFSKTLVEASPAFFAAISPEGQTLMMNEAMLNALDYTLDEVVESDYLSSFVTPSDRDRVSENFKQLTQIQTTLSSESRILTKDGRELLVEWHHRAVFKTNSELNFIFGVGIDITVRKQAEEALRQSEARFREQAQQLQLALHELQRTQAQLVQTEKMSSLGQMVAGVAHEINNPVNFIYGNLSHAKEYTQDLIGLVQVYQQNYPNPAPQVQERLEDIELDFLIEDLPKMLSSMELGADRIRQIVLSLRNFSRLDEAEKKPVNIHEGLDSTLLILHNRLRAKPGHPEIEIVKEYGNLPLVECYAGQLNQVFMNILSNGIDALETSLENRQEATPAPSPKIWIRTNLKSEKSAIDDGSVPVSGPTSVEIRISDNGPGISETVRRRLFDPFFTTKPVGKGTGLGLSISYQVVVERHGGQLKCFSEPEKGAEFVIEIPIR